MQLKWLSIADLIAQAGGDPWAINQSLQAGSPAQISSLAEAFHGAGRHTAEADHAFQQARQRFGAAWNHQNGDHPINDAAEVQRLVKTLGAQSERLPRIGADLENIAAALAEAQKAGTQRIATLEHELQGLDNIIDAAEHDLQHGHPDAKTEAFLKKLIDDAKADAADDVRDALHELQSIRDGYEATLRNCLGNLRTDGYDPNILAPVDADDQIPPPSTNPEDVHRWWTSLTPQQRQRFMAEHPDQVGNLNGVPILARNDANLTVMNQDLDRVRGIASRNGVSVDDVLRDPAKFGLSATDVTRYHNANETKLGLDHDAGDPLHPNPVYLFAYDPIAFGGKGRAAIAIGNPDIAKNTAVIVPGTSSSVKGGWLHDGHNDAINLFEQANAADPHNPTAVIAWMGYDAPNGFDDVVRISTPELARTGSAALAQDVNGLWATHLGAGQHVTVLGHSYGSTTVADAFAMHNMHANDAVLLGCPGTDRATTAASFHLDGGHVFVGDASTDPVGMLGHLDGASKQIFGENFFGNNPSLGGDPAVDGFGSVRFRAEVPGSDGINPHDHSYYYHRGSEALYGMADIVSGHGDQLQADGMTAEHRHSLGGVQVRIPGLPPVTIGPHTPAVVDPEWDRSPGSITDNHVFDAQHHH